MALRFWVRACAICVGVAGVAGAAAAAGLSTVRIASGLSSPIYATAPTGDSRLFIVERAGRIRILQNGAVLPTPFLDIHDRVGLNGEGGLLGLVFSPTYASDGAFYVYYTKLDSGAPAGFDSQLSRFHATQPFATSTTADPTEEPIFSTPQPFTNHNGGTVAIRDGFLYLALGDGGNGGDPDNNAQNDASPLGKLLRFDLSQQSPAAEVWAKGLRNPFRYAFDRSTGDLYIGDVGQDSWEEIDVTPADAPKGLNYGWAVMEGRHCYKHVDGAPQCNDPSLTLPVAEYAHDQGCAVTGGSVYRGAAIPSLQGEYFFSDYCSGNVWSFHWDGTNDLQTVVDRNADVVPDQGSIANITAIAEDGFGELDFVSLDGGAIYKLVPEPGAGALALAACAALGALGRASRARTDS